MKSIDINSNDVLKWCFCHSVVVFLQNSQSRIKLARLRELRNPFKTIFRQKNLKNSFSFYSSENLFDRLKFMPNLFESRWTLSVCLRGRLMSWCHGLRGEGVKAFCDNSTKALVIKREGVSKIVQNCVTSFVDDPLSNY